MHTFSFIIIFISISLGAQLEKIDAYLGTLLVVHKYHSQTSNKVSGVTFFIL